MADLLARRQPGPALAAARAGLAALTAQGHPHKCPRNLCACIRYAAVALQAHRELGNWTAGIDDLRDFYGNSTDFPPAIVLLCASLLDHVQQQDASEVCTFVHAESSSKPTVISGY